MSTIFILIPAFNEEDRIEKTISALQEKIKLGKIFVIDDGSTDLTSEKAKKAGATVFRLEKNLGKGRALKEGINRLQKTHEIKDDNIFLFVDADTSRSACEASMLVDELKKRGTGHFTIAVFPKPKKKGGFGLVKNLARKFLEKETGFQFKAPLSGQRAVYWCDLKKAFEAFDFGYGLEVAMNYLLAKNNVKPVEIELNMTHRETGRSLKDFIHRGKQFLDVLKVIYFLKWKK